ncbi:hypothetical protein BASA60_011154 [Batrachochytrium salamandrivorans]|nr:hypothetical protein BASA60_011154 [Batrachochytrium salamandrivorans]KAH9263512.1 hypothetical protein BASA83_013089 [Batrachochytrium salamandrivorans]
MPEIPSVYLRNGVKIPCIGLGTYRLKGEQVYSVIQTAIRLGYRHIDTAAVYGNEQEIGRAISHLIHAGDITRSELFITSKIGPKSQGYANAHQSIVDSLDKLGPDVGYLDLMLIHWPGSQGLQKNDPCNAVRRKETWLALNEAYRSGKIRAIGVSNFTKQHMDDIVSVDVGLEAEETTSPLEVPMVNQFELHPLLWCDSTRDLISACHALGCRVQGYSCLGSGSLTDGSITGTDGLTLSEVAKRVGATTSQILIRWAIERGDIVMPKSSSETRLKENLDAALIQLSDMDMAWLDQLAGVSGVRRFCWDPTKIN